MEGADGFCEVRNKVLFGGEEGVWLRVGEGPVCGSHGVMGQ